MDAPALVATHHHRSMRRRKRIKESQTRGDEEAGGCSMAAVEEKRAGMQDAAQRTQTKSTGCCDFRTIASKVTDGQGLDFGLGRAEPSPDPLRNKLKLLPACFEARANFKKRSTRAYVTVTVPQNPVAAVYQVGGLLVPSTE